MDFSVHQHMLPRQNSKLLAPLANQSEILHRTPRSSVGFLQPCCDNRDTYLQSHQVGCWGPIGKSLPSEQQPENKLDKTQLIASSLVLNQTAVVAVGTVSTEGGMHEPCSHLCVCVWQQWWVA